MAHLQRLPIAKQAKQPLAGATSCQTTNESRCFNLLVAGASSTEVPPFASKLPLCTWTHIIPIDATLANLQQGNNAERARFPRYTDGISSEVFTCIDCLSVLFIQRCSVSHILQQLYVCRQRPMAVRLDAPNDFLLGKLVTRQRDVWCALVSRLFFYACAFIYYLRCCSSVSRRYVGCSSVLISCICNYSSRYSTL